LGSRDSKRRIVRWANADADAVVAVEAGAVGRPSECVEEQPTSIPALRPTEATQESVPRRLVERSTLHRTARALSRELTVGD
jgi:hypothetical protein